MCLAIRIVLVLKICHFWQDEIWAIARNAIWKQKLCFHFTLIRWPFPSPSPASRTPLWPQRLSSCWNCCLTESPRFFWGWRWRFAGNQGISMMMGSSWRVRLTGHQLQLLLLLVSKKRENWISAATGFRSRLVIFRPKTPFQLLQPFAATVISHSSKNLWTQQRILRSSLPHKISTTPAS